MRLAERARRSIRSRLESRGLVPREAWITQATGRRLEGAPCTAVLLCSPFFDQSVPNASTTIRTGLARGFEAVGVPYLFLSVRQLNRLGRMANPIVLLTESDYAFLDDQAIARLREIPHAVWVNPWPANPGRLYEEFAEGGFTHDAPTRERVLRSEPRFVYAVSPPSAREMFDLWSEHGLRLESVPLACDVTHYTTASGPPRFAGVRMAFVGGYWPYKARNFDRFLKPHEDALTVFGYSPWPYAGFGGQLSTEDEPFLYRDAVLSPAINEPHARVTGDVCERVFKVLGSGGLCITDTAPHHRDLFRPDEVLMPDSVETFHDMVRDVLRDPAPFAQYRERGREAVLKRHTYAHRARQLLDAFGVGGAAFG